jgi:cation transport regulator ChaC
MAELWVFGCGSLMWRPGFEFTEQAATAPIRAHRSRMSLPQRMPNNSLTPPEVHL